jgi:hypothetical protein
MFNIYIYTYIYVYIKYIFLNLINIKCIWYTFNTYLYSKFISIDIVQIYIKYWTFANMNWIFDVSDIRTAVQSSSVTSWLHSSALLFVIFITLSSGSLGAEICWVLV